MDIANWSGIYYLTHNFPEESEKNLKILSQISEPED